MAPQYRETPIDTDRMPPGIGYIVGNEAAERFSFYGMRAILYVFMTKHLVDAAGNPATMTTEKATEVVSNWTSILYFLPLVGGLIADAVLGKYLTIMSMSLIYCVGHFVLALTLNPAFTGGLIEPWVGLYTGLGLIALGGGFIKSCVSAHVGDQFGAGNAHLLGRVYGWFYFSINFGSTASTLLTPKLLDWYGPDVAFGVPGLFMLLATIAFWLGRNRYAHVPPKGTATIKEAFSREGRKALANLALIYVFIFTFWAIFDQTPTRWVEQAEHMDRYYVADWLPDWATDSAANVIANPDAAGAAEILADVPADSRVFAVLESQMQAVNPALVMLYIPLFGFTLYPWLDKAFGFTYFRKIGLGLFLTACGWGVSTLIQQWIDAGQTPDILWQVLAYAVLTAGEVMVSITGLEISYAYAPKAMKSTILAVWLLTVSMGNIYISVLNRMIDNGTIDLKGADYYEFWFWAMLATAILFVPATYLFRGKRYIGGDGDTVGKETNDAGAGRVTADPAPVTPPAAAEHDRRDDRGDRPAT